MDNDRLIQEHQAIWTEFHEPLGISLSDSKYDWFTLLREDPEMEDPWCWGDLAGTTTESERQAFRAWLR